MGRKGGAMYDAVAFLATLYAPADLPDPVAPSIGPDDLPGDWRVEWEERAAIMEYEGNMPRERAEALALADIVGRMGMAPQLGGG